jgi:DNA-binding Lrp family transcriptional regulator
MEDPMGTKAYVLIEVAVGKAKAVTAEILKLEGVQTVDVVMGTFDIIAIVNTSDISAVASLVTGDIHTIDGVLRTQTCLAVVNVE